MASTTIRVDSDTHAKLLELSTRGGATLMDTVRDAAEALRRLRFAGQVASELEALRSNEAAWSEYIAEAQSTDVTDGIR